MEIRITYFNIFSKIYALMDIYWSQNIDALPLWPIVKFGIVSEIRHHRLSDPWTNFAQLW